MRTANKQNQQTTPINERKNHKSNQKNFSKSPIKQKQSNQVHNQYAAIEQAKRDFQKIEKGNYLSNKKIIERKFSKENFSSKNSKNSDYEISKDDVENRPLAVKQINSYVNKKIDNNYNNRKLNNSKEKIQNYSQKMPMRNTHIAAGNSSYIYNQASNDSNKEKHFSNPKINNGINQNRDKRNTCHINNIGLKNKELCANELVIEIKNNQAYSGKNISTSLAFNSNTNCEKNIKQKETNNNLNSLIQNVNSSNSITKNFGKFNFNSTKNKQINNKADSTYVYSENLNHLNFANIKKDDCNNNKNTYSKVNVNIPINPNCEYNNLHDLKDATLKSNNETDKENELNNKIKLLVNKIKEKKTHENEKSNKELKPPKTQIRLSNTEDANYNNDYDFPLQISPSTRSREITCVIADLQYKNELLSNQLSSFREKFIDQNYLKNEAIAKRKDKNKSKSSQRSLGIAPISHDKKKSIDNNNNNNYKFSKSNSIVNDSFNKENNYVNNYENLSKINFFKNDFIENSEKKKDSEATLKTFTTNKLNNHNDIRKFSSSKANLDNFNYLKDESNYNKNNANKIDQNNIIKERESRSIENKINFKTENAFTNNFIYESSKIKSTKYLYYTGIDKLNINSNKNIKNNFDKSINNNYEETEKINSIKNIKTNPETFSSWNALAISSSIPKSPLKRLQDKVTEKENEISSLEQKLKEANSIAMQYNKSVKKAENKVESLQRIINEILSKNKADQGAIKKLQEEIIKFNNDEDAFILSNSNCYSADKFFEEFENKEFILHKIYSNFDTENKFTEKETNNINNNNNNNYNNTFYFVLISDASKKKFTWVDLTISFLTILNEKDDFEKKKNLLKNKSTLKSTHKYEVLITDAIVYFDELANKYKNSLNKSNDNSISGLKESAKSHKTASKLTEMEIKSWQTGKYKNFIVNKFPLQNLYSLETKLLAVYSQYLSFEHEFNKSKNLFADELNKKETVICTLRLDLEKLLEDNSACIDNYNLLKKELGQKETKLDNFDLLNKEKDMLIAELNGKVVQLNEKFEQNFENKSALEARIAELQEIVIQTEKNLRKENEKMQIKYTQISFELEEANKNLSEKDFLIENFSQKLEELEAKYKTNFKKIEFIEKSEMHIDIDSNYNGDTDELGKLQAKVHDLEMLKNSNLDKISILEFINKNFENDKAEKEKLIEELTYKLSEYKNQDDNLKLFQQENINLKIMLNDKETSIEKSLLDFKTLITSKESEIQLIKKENNEIKEKEKNCLKELSNLNKALDSSKLDNNELENKAEKLRKEIKEVNFLLEEKISNLFNANKKIMDLEAQIRFNFEKFDEEKSRIREEMNTNLNCLESEKTDLLARHQGLMDEFKNHQHNFDKAKKQNEENLGKLKLENKNLKKNLNELMQKSELENKELEDLLNDFNRELENSAKIKIHFSEAEIKLKKLDSVLLMQEQSIEKLRLENEEIANKLEEEIKSKLNLNNKNYFDNNNKIQIQTENRNSFNINKDNETNQSITLQIGNLNNRILEIQKINIELEHLIKEKDLKLQSIESEKNIIVNKLNEAKESCEKFNALIIEKNKKSKADEFTIKDLTRKLKDIELDLKNTEDENLVYKNKINELQKNLNILSDKQNTFNLKNSKIQIMENSSASQYETEIRLLNEENLKLKKELEKARNECEKLLDELNENNLLKLDGNITKRGDEVNVTLYGNNNIFNTNLNNSSHLNNSMSLLDLNNTNNNININSTNALTNSTPNLNNFINYNNSNCINDKNNIYLLNSNKKDKENNNDNNNEYMLKIIDYEDKLEKLIFSNSEIARKNHSLTIEIKTLQERIYALENFEEPEINKKLKQMKSKEKMTVACENKDLNSLRMENERLQELIKDYEISISELQNKLELQSNEINRIKEEYKDEINQLKKKEVENFSFFANEKTERNISNNNINCGKNNINNSNLNNMTFFENNEFDNKNFNCNRYSFSNDEYFKRLNAEICEKNKLIDKLTKELNDSYALMGEANKKLEIFEVDYLNKSK